jgi:membrane-bound ClpP family serine protease
VWVKFYLFLFLLSISLTLSYFLHLDTNKNKQKQTKTDRQTNGVVGKVVDEPNSRGFASIGIGKQTV